MSFTQFFRILWAWRAIILISTFSCLVAGFLIGKTMPPRYEAKSRLLLDILRPDPVTGQSISSIATRPYVQTQTELIRDYRVAGKVVDAFGWTSSPILAAQYAARRADDKRDFRRWLAQRIIDNTQAKLVSASNILEITFTSTSPDTARKAVDAVRQAYVEQTLAFKRETAAKNSAWFRNQAAKIRVDLAAAEKRKADFEAANGIILQSDNRDTESAKLEAMAATTLAPQTTITAATAAATSPASAQLAQMDAQIAAAEQSLGPNHPDLINMRRQRDAVAASAAQQQAASVRAAQAGAGGPTGPSMASLISAQTQKVLAQRGKVVEAQRIASEVSVLRAQFDKTVSKVADYDQEAQTTEAGVTMLGNAVAPEDPVAPNIPLIVMGSFAFGLVFGILTALIVELINRRVRSVEDLAVAGVPVIGIMTRPIDTTGVKGIWHWLGLPRSFLKRKPI